MTEEKEQIILNHISRMSYKKALSDLYKKLTDSNDILVIQSLLSDIAKLKEENHAIRRTLKHIENNRKQKADKLIRIEKLATNCIAGGYTDEFIQEIFNTCREVEE